MHAAPARTDLPSPSRQGAGVFLRGLPGFGEKPSRAENRFGLDYTRVASALGPPVCPIIDIHTHVNGRHAPAVYAQAATMFGISHVTTQVPEKDASIVRDALAAATGDPGFVSFIGFPEFRHADRAWAFSAGYLEQIPVFRARHGAKMIKLWNAPRMFELFPGEVGQSLIAFDSPWRVKHVERAQGLGMGIMVHVADPNTWFATKYADASTFLRKAEHYPALERMMDRFAGPWIAAHMGGCPEDLDFLDGLLTRHDNLWIDTSATKWVVRELSRHPAQRVREFFRRWEGRILFGSDIVTMDDHLGLPGPTFPTTTSTPPQSAPSKHPMADLANSPQTAFDLYASRYVALRLLFETDYIGESPISDPDLALVNPALASDATLPAPLLQGIALPASTLRTLYRGAAETLWAKLG